MNATVLVLTLHGLSFFAVSPWEARAMAVRAVELSGPDDDEADLVELYSLIWRANRDARRIQDGAHNMPVYQQLRGPLPESYLIDPQPRGGAYAHLYDAPDYDALERYDVQRPEWMELEIAAQREGEAGEVHVHNHEHPELPGRHHAH